MRKIIYISLALLAFACDIPDLQEHNFKVYLKNAVTGEPEVGTKVVVDVVNDILGERYTGTTYTTDDSGSFSHHYKNTHKFLIFKAAEDEPCAELTCDNRKSDSTVWFSYAVIDVENIDNNKDTTHYKNFTDSIKEVHLWVYRCGKVTVTFQNIASDKDTNGIPQSYETYRFCTSDEAETIELNGNGVVDSVFEFNVYADNTFYYERTRSDSTGTFTIEDSVVIEPAGSYNITIDQFTINSRP